MVAAMGLLFGSVGLSALAEEGWTPSSPAAYPEVAGALLTSNSTDDHTKVAYAIASPSDRYDPYTCTAAYGDAFCATFERCMASQGFDACYEKIDRQLP